MRREYEEPTMPERGTRPGAALRIFNDSADAILNEWLRRQSKKPTRRAESPNAWFKREAYRLLRHYIENGLTSVFHSNVEEDRRPTRLAIEARKNPFKLGLLAMFSDELALSRGNRHVFGNQMFYAWLHDVPPEFLNAFLAISGGPALVAEKLREGFVEPGFEKMFRPDRVAQFGGEPS